MSDTLVIGDIHFGKKNNDLKMFESQMSFFKKQFFPYILENNIKKVICLGDLFDHKTNQDVNLLLRIRSEFLNFFESNEVEFHTILGNHDIYYKRSRDVATIRLFDYMKYINIIDKPTLIDIDGIEWELFPWLLEGEKLSIRSPYIMGHFEINGFYMSSYKCSNGAKLDDFYVNENGVNLPLKKLISGHFHIKQESEIVMYAGTPYAMDWNDKNSDKGFYHIKNNELVFIHNEINKLYYEVYQIKNDKSYIELGEDGIEVLMEDISYTYKINEDEIGADELSSLTRTENFVKLITKDKDDLENISVGENTIIDIRIPEPIYDFSNQDFEDSDDQTVAADRFCQSRLSEPAYDKIKTILNGIFTDGK